ncbi:ANR family transcriptional regulator [Pantoea eucrina]|uniref:ANR family transcriptional regulator n=1 Tax=Pantoea eucrina TaxID=472693 RepID=UPI00080F556A|nr:ANR family transcriptional regulator [Pantoea eucrina]
MTFSELADKAKHQESVACFGAAAQYWIAANKAARKQENKEWAANRAMYCSRMHALKAGPR